MASGPFPAWRATGACGACIAFGSCGTAGAGCTCGSCNCFATCGTCCACWNLRSLSLSLTKTFTTRRGLRHLDLSISHVIQTEKSCGSDEDSKKSPLLWLSAGRKLSKKRMFSILFMPSWLRNQRAYAGLVLIKHYNNLSYRISLGVLWIVHEQCKWLDIKFNFTLGYSF